MKIKGFFNDFKVNFYISISALIIATVSLFFIPMVNINGIGVSRVFAYVIGALFWLSVIAEQIFFWRANLFRHKLEMQMQKNGGKIIKRRIGIISFFKNKEAVIVDIILFMSVIAVAIILILNIMSDWLIILCLAILFISFNLHCILNGINYMYIKSNKKFLEGKE